MKTWTIDNAHSEIAFKVKHLMISTVRGTFGEFAGSVSATDDSLSDATFEFSAQVKSVNTQNAGRDGHLVTADFFDAEKFPIISFKSTSVTKSGNDFEVTGDFMLKGVTKTETFKVAFGGMTTGMDGKKVLVFEITGEINRNDFGLTWNSAIEAGGVVLGDMVKIEGSIEAKEA